MMTRDALSAGTEGLVAMAYQVHRDAGHDGSPLDCPDAWCEAVWIDLRDVIRTEILVARAHEFEAVGA